MCTRIRKGIINPNYPGFQSLAYTLNDDHFDYSSENPSDDEEDSYVSESDDNEMKRHDRGDGVGDENGNSYGDDDVQKEHQRGQQAEDVENPFVAVSTGGQETSFVSTLYPGAATETTAGGEKMFGSMPVQRSRMRLIPSGCHSPTSFTTATRMIETEEKLDSSAIYACTPPDIVLQHSCEHRPGPFGTPDEQLMASLELSNIQRPDLIPEQQQQQEQKKNELNRQEFQLKQDDILDEQLDVEEEVEDLNVDDDVNEEVEPIERNQTPPSPAIERGIGTISISNSSNSSSHFLRNVSLSPDPMLEDVTQCYGSASDATLSDDSDHSDPESDEGDEFGYRPYDDGATDGSFRRTPDMIGSPSPSGGDSAGSSPGEVQYHLVDDCSNQTVQITRSRQSVEHSPTKQYHALLQQYSSHGPADYCNNQTQLTEREVNCNDRYPSLEELAQTSELTAPVDYPVSTDYPNVRAQTFVNPRREPALSTQKPHAIHRSALEEARNIIGETVQSSPETLAPATKTYQKGIQHDPRTGYIVQINMERCNLYLPTVPKVNPFCELLLQENDTCDFFTKQAKLQIEARMALCQAKDMAHMQMEIEKRSLPLSPVTQVIHTAVEKAGLCLAADKRRLSRYYLTRLNVAQLRTILLELQGHAEVLNEELVQLLMERDDLHISQDATLVDIEDLSRYLCAKEQTILHAERQRKSYHWNSNKTIYHPVQHQMQPHPQPQPMRSPCGAQSTVPAYRYH
ncbi:AGAP002089-PA-like protein [Anopheles sinensis]|uniref:AGAP002089-PA-like protein n=1 Tax=Anopheles sinensis TaxID=74873 RepID=A0A084WSI0_ANOSI|nr:AGAP002089-PA-like protein [Anopheles sinensis]